MKQTISKSWGLTPEGAPAALHHLVADSVSDLLPSDLPAGSDCLFADGTKKVFLVRETVWVTVKEGGSGGGGEGGGASIDDTAISGGSCWSSAKTNGMLSQKADVSGVFPEMTAGAARTLLGYDATNARFLFEETGGGASIGRGSARIVSVRGSTVHMSQVARPSAAGTVTLNGVTAVRDGNGAVTVSTAPEGASEDTLILVCSASVKQGRRYLRRGCPFGGSTGTYSFGYDEGEGYAYTAAKTTGIQGQISIKAGTVIEDPVVFYPQIFDLTEMFGEGAEPSAREFRRMFPAHYYAYTSKPALLNFEATGLRAVGFNAFDGEKARVIGACDGAGENHGYEIHGAYTAVKFAYTENGEKYPLEVQSYHTEKGDAVMRILPPDTGYVFIEGAGQDTCLNLIRSGERSGAGYVYEPYRESLLTLPETELFPDGLRSCKEVFDEIDARGAFKRVGTVDLGTLNWRANGTSMRQFYASDLQNLAKGDPSGSGGNVSTDFIETARYQTVYSAQGEGICVAKGSGQLWLCIDGYESVAALKAAMSGYELRYELKTPETVTFESELDLSVNVTEAGTEELLCDGATSFGDLMIEYPVNIQEVISRLPTDYISKKSFDAFLDELYTQTGVSVQSEKSGDRYIYRIDPGARFLPAPTPADAGKTVKVNADGSGYELTEEV